LRFSIVIPWRHRPELAKTLKINRPWFDRYAAEVIVVNCGGDPAEASALIEAHPIPGVRQVLLPVESFSKALACNVGAWCSSSELLFFLDTDIVVRSDVFHAAGDLLAQRPCFVKIRTVRETRPQKEPATRFLKEQVSSWRMVSTTGQRATVHFYTQGDGSRCGSGLLLLKKADLISVGGFNSGLQGWGFEDLDLNIRLQFLAKLRPYAIGETIHLTHGDQVRDVTASSRSENYRLNMMACFENYSQQQLMGTYAQDIETWCSRLREIGSPDRAPLEPPSHPAAATTPGHN
jgi:hypothetical protein